MAVQWSPVCLTEAARKSSSIPGFLKVSTMCRRYLQVAAARSQLQPQHLLLPGAARQLFPALRGLLGHLLHQLSGGLVSVRPHVPALPAALLPGVPDTPEHGGHHQPRQPRHHVGGPPPLAQQVRLSQVDPEQEGEAVSKVDLQEDVVELLEAAAD